MGVGIGILGFGTVGSGVYKALALNGAHIVNRVGIDLKVEKILVRDLKKTRNIEINPSMMTEDFQEIINNKEIKIVVEVMGGIEPAHTYIKACIEKGIHVVTANKALMAAKGRELRQLAESRGVDLKYEASVAGAIPIISVLDTALCGEQLSQVAGIINGSTNYILSRMSEEGSSYEEIFADAQRLGYVEADPTSDVEGFDATYKLCILAKKAFGFDALEENVLREGITKISALDIQSAKELGYSIKLLATGKKADGKIELRVHPTLVPLNHLLAKVSGPFNAVFVKGNCFGEMMFYGRGAGDLPTASAVVGDIVSVLRLQFLTSGSIPYDFTETAKLVEIADIEMEKYLSVDVTIDSKAVERITGCFSENNVGIKTIKTMGASGQISHLAILTEKSSEAVSDLIVAKLSTLDGVVRVNNVIRMESEI